MTSSPADYEAALSKIGERERTRALAALGGTWVEREGVVIGQPRGQRTDPLVADHRREDGDDPSSVRIAGTAFTENGHRYLAVGRGARGYPVKLAKIGKRLHVVELEPRTFLVRVTYCGAMPCTYGSGAMARDTSEPISVELAPDEQAGELLSLHYDQFTLQPGYAREASCPPPPPGARAR